MRLSQEVINDILHRADIVDVIGRYLPLVKSGNSYKAVCPFHDDHDPSMTISRDKQIYKCFVCGAGGNVFGFVKEYEKISFVEAVSKVAEYVGVHLDVDLPKAKPGDPQKQGYYQVLNETISFCGYQLQTPGGSLAKQYLENRGIHNELIQRFDLGYNPPQDSLMKFLQAKGYGQEAAVQTNVLRINEYGIHDTFSNRIMFPIHDFDGNPIGFSARALDPDTTSKYINTTETPLYVKGQTLYNAHRAKSEAKEKGKVIVVEGVTDVIALAKAGIYHCVATLGTACTPQQIDLMKKLAPVIVFNYDGDRAGQNAIYKAGKLALSRGCRIVIVDNPYTDDPDEIIAKYGIERLQEVVTKEISWMQFVFDYLKSNVDLDNYMDKKEFALKVVGEIEALPEKMDQQYFYQQLSQLTGFPLEALRKQEAKGNKKNNVKAQKKSTTAIPVRFAYDGKTGAERLILSMMLNSAEALEQFKNQLGFLITPELQQLAMMIVDAAKIQPNIQVSELLNQCEDEKVRQALLDISVDEMLAYPYERDLMSGAIQRIKASMLDAKIADLKKQIQTVTNDQSKMILMNEYQHCLIERKRYNDEAKDE